MSLLGNFRIKARPAVVVLDAGDPWKAEWEIVADPDPAAEYGFHTGRERHACTRQQLAFQCCAMPGTPLVWTPETGTMVGPEAVPFLVEELASDRLRKARRGIRRSAPALAAVLGGFALWPQGFRSIVVLVPCFLAIWLLESLHARVEALRIDADAFPAARAQLRHAAWVDEQPTRYTPALFGVLIALYVAEELCHLPSAVEAAGLVKHAVRDGELWRLLTGPLLHGGTMHIWMNGGALLATGRLIEVHSRREYLPLTFLVAALAGSVVSVVVYPQTTSVGASGGIMGLTGFLLVLGSRQRASLPPGFARGVLVGIAAMALVGLVGFAVIDNAAHFGGLLGGVLVGHVLERRGMIYPAQSAGSRFWGYFAAAVILAGAVVAVIAIYSSRTPG